MLQEAVDSIIAKPRRVRQVFVYSLPDGIIVLSIFCLEFEMIKVAVDRENIIAVKIIECLRIDKVSIADRKASCMGIITFSEDLVDKTNQSLTIRAENQLYRFVSRY